MKKIYLVIIPLLFLCILAMVAYAYKTKHNPIVSIQKPVKEDASKDAKINFDISNLKLDQGNAFIALSKNDGEGYNRCMPFYFNLTTTENLSVEDVENLLNEELSTATLHTNDGTFYQTDQLIFSVFKLETGTYNLTLVLTPEVNSLQLDGVETITHIELGSTKNSHKYELPSYLIEERETLPEEEFYVSLSSIETDILEDLSADVNYGIVNYGKEITNFSLDFSEKLSTVKDYHISDIVQTEDDSIEYSVVTHLKEKSAATVFRPFLKIEYGKGKSGWLVPSVPVYFK